MAPRHRVCHSLANARLISRMMSPPREERDVKLLPAGPQTANRGHSVFSLEGGREGEKKEQGGGAS